jgi:tetratricopeptide (TPR) repeat protein
VVDEERPHVVWASGPPGIGKSRLRRELERRAEARGDVALLVGRAEPLGRESALSLLGTALQSYAKRGAARGAWPSVDGSASLEARQGAVREFVHAVIEDDERAEQCADFLGVLFGVEMPENPETTAAGRDLRLMADRLKLAVHGFFASVAAKQPVALLLEDVQWADQASLDVLQDLVERLSDSPLFVLVTSRSELRDRHPDLFSGLGARVLDLPRLRRPEVGLLCEHLVGHQLPAPVIDAVTERTGGNPLFVEQIVRALDEESLLTSPPSRLPLPLTVEAAVQSRLDHLPPDEKDLCKRAALFGRPFVARELEVLGAQQPTRLLESLRRRELVFSARSHPQAEKQYRFRSSLVGEVAYRMLSDQPRQELHLAAARHLVQREDIDPEEAAIHFERGQQPGQAANGYADAVRVATRQGDSQRVLRCADKALALGPALARVFDLHMARAEAHGFLGQREDQGLALAEALDSADDARKQARVRISQVTWLTRTSRLSDAIEAGEEAIALADQVEDPELCVMARVRHTSALVFSGRFDEADIVMRHARSLTRKVSTHTRAFVAEWEAHLASSRGDMGERHRAFSETVRLFFEAGDVRRAAANESNLADTYNRLGAYEEAEAALRDALDGCRRVGNRPGEGYALLNLAYALGELGRIEDALAALNEAEALPTVHEDTRLSLTVRLYRARVRLPVAPAAELATEAEELSRQAYRDGFPTLRVGALALAARAYLRGEDASRALACSEEALRARDALGSVEEDEAEAFLVHAMALEVVGRSEMARDVVLRGCSRLRYIAARIADPEWRRRFLEDVPAHKALLERE